MKKLKSIMLTLLLLGSVVLSAFGGPITDAAENTGTVADETTVENVEIVLHKRIFRDLRWYKKAAVEEWNYQNDGLEIDGDLVSTPFNGAIFQVFDADALVAEAYENAKEADATITPEEIVENVATMKPAAALAKAAELNLTEITNDAEGTPLITATDAEFGDGILRLTVPTTNDEGAYKSYLIVETGVTDAKEMNVDMEKYSHPLLVILPIAVDDVMLEQIHIYPKNVGYVRDPYFFKYGKNADGEDIGPVEGAEFVIYREDEAGEKWYLDMSETTDLRNKWVVSEDPLNDERVNKFVSDKDGLVNTGERFLPSGIFYFEEVKAAEGFVIEAEQRRIKIEIPEAWVDEDGNELPVLIDGQPMIENPSGEVPEAAMEAATPRIYNLQETPDPEPEPEPEPSTSDPDPEPTPSSSEPEPSSSSEPTPTPSTTIPSTRPSLPGTGTTTKPSGVLPKTGAQKATVSVLGIVILVGVGFIIWRRKKVEE